MWNECHPGLLGGCAKVFKEKVGGDKALSETSGIAMPRARKHPKLSTDERAFLNRLYCLNEEEIKQLTTREIFAYFKIIDKVDSSSLLKNLKSSVFVLRFSSSYKRSVRFGSEWSRLVATLPYSELTRS